MSQEEILPDHEENTKVLAFHLFIDDWKTFMAICRNKKVFHSEILRKLVQQFIEENKYVLREEDKDENDMFG